MRKYAFRGVGCSTVNILANRISLVVQIVPFHTIGTVNSDLNGTNAFLVDEAVATQAETSEFRCVAQCFTKGGSFLLRNNDLNPFPRLIQLLILLVV
jgi:hypothetical protein